MHIFEAFPIHKTDRVVVVGEALQEVHFVLEDAAVEVVRHSYVESAARTALEDVDVKAMLAGHALRLRVACGACSALGHP
jgi:hypothetical protein